MEIVLHVENGNCEVDGYRGCHLQEPEVGEGGLPSETGNMASYISFNFGQDRGL